MKNRELKNLYMALTGCAQVPGSAKWCYGITKNLDHCESEIRCIMAVEAKLNEYQDKRVKLCEELCDKGKDGKPVMVIENGEQNYAGVASHPEWKGKKGALDKEYKAVIDEVNDFMDSMIVGVRIHKIKMDDIPDGLAPVVFKALMPVIVGE